MPYSVTLMRKIDQVDPELKEVLWGILDEIEQHREQSVTKTEFNELKEIVRDLAQAQQRTEQRVEELAQAQKDLAQAQQRTEQRVEELTQAQQRTEDSLQELAREVAKLSRGLDNTRSQVGGLARSAAYALENEAYRKLPAYLEAHHDLQLLDRFIRMEIEGQEINIFAKARRNGDEVLIVGESVLRFDDRSKAEQLEDNVTLVQETYHLPVVPLLITHYARPYLLKLAQKEGIIVVQSFEWEE